MAKCKGCGANVNGKYCDYCGTENMDYHKQLAGSFPSGSFARLGSNIAALPNGTLSGAVGATKSAEQIKNIVRKNFEGYDSDF